MKKGILLSSLVLFVSLIITSCVRTVNVGNNENYWLTQERGEVVFSDSYCNYYVVETMYGYTVIRANNGYKPYEGATVYGDFGRYGYRDFYDYYSGRVITGEVIEYDLTYTEAQYAVDYYCPYSRGEKIKESNTMQSKVARPKENPVN